MARKTVYNELGIYSDMLPLSPRGSHVGPTAAPGAATRRRLMKCLAFRPGPERPQQVRVEKTWEAQGLEGELVSWSVGYGPRTEAWLLRPAGASGRLPGVVALHDHGGFKYYGKEKIADGPGGPAAGVGVFRRNCYGGAAFANELARRGFVVLVPDVFAWGSRRQELDVMGEAVHFHTEAAIAAGAGADYTDASDEIRYYNAAAGFQEHCLEKALRVMGTTLAGVVSYEDRVAAAYLASRPEVRPGGLGCVGLSGGGMRSVLMQATCTRIRAAVAVGAMCTYQGLLDRKIGSHTWMIYPADFGRWGDWSDIAACRAPSPLLVQYDKEDPLFTPRGMREAHKRLEAHYHGAGAPRAYRGEFYPGLHKFDAPMQDAAFRWLQIHLGR